MIQKYYMLEVKYKNGWELDQYYQNVKTLNAMIVHCISHGLAYRVTAFTARKIETPA